MTMAGDPHATWSPVSVDVSDAWMLEQHEHVVRIGREAAIPAGHPLSRLALGNRPTTGLRRVGS